MWYVDVWRHDSLAADPECCDGSDETDGKVRCENVCAKVNKAYQRRKSQAKKVHETGARVRAKNIEMARVEKQKDISKLESLRNQLPDAVKLEERLRQMFEQAGDQEALVQEQKRQNRTYESLFIALSLLTSSSIFEAGETPRRAQSTLRCV